LSLHDVLYRVLVLDEGYDPHLCFAFTSPHYTSAFGYLVVGDVLSLLLPATLSQ
jgi:hypothetical protein